MSHGLYRIIGSGVLALVPKSNQKPLKHMKKRKCTCLLLITVLSTAVLCIAPGKKVRTTGDLKNIAAMGGGLVLDASDRDVNDLMEIAAFCGTAGGALYLKNCAGIDTTNLMNIAAYGKRHVVIEF